jgi:hypothetical protein
MASIVFHNFPVFHSSFPWFSTIFLEYYLSLPLLPGTEARHPRRGRGGRDGRHGLRRRLRSLHPQVAAHAGGAAATGQVRASGIAMAVFLGLAGLENMTSPLNAPCIVWIFPTKLADLCNLIGGYSSTMEHMGLVKQLHELEGNW